eukprot:1157021-Pelagomonas_calceolata.AAC.11
MTAHSKAGCMPGYPAKFEGGRGSHFIYKVGGDVGQRGGSTPGCQLYSGFSMMHREQGAGSQRVGCHLLRLPVHAACQRPPLHMGVAGNDAGRLESKKEKVKSDAQNEPLEARSCQPPLRSRKKKSGQQSIQAPDHPGMINNETSMRRPVLWQGHPISLTG